MVERGLSMVVFSLMSVFVYGFCCLLLFFTFGRSELASRVR